VRADDAHAVRPAERNPRLATDGNQLVLAAASRLVALGESGVKRDRGADPLPSGEPEAVEHALVVDAEGEHVDTVGQVLDRLVAGPAE